MRLGKALAQAARRPRGARGWIGLRRIGLQSSVEVLNCLIHAPLEKKHVSQVAQSLGKVGRQRDSALTQQSSLVERARVAGVAQVLTEIRKGNGIVGLEHNSRAEGQGSLGPPVE